MSLSKVKLSADWWAVIVGAVGIVAIKLGILTHLPW